MINNITKVLLTITTILVTPFKWIMFVPAYFLVSAPIIKIIYEVLVTIIWLPFGSFITLISILYQGIPILGALLAILGIPVVLIGYAISYILSPRIKEERAYIAACQSYPSVGDII